MGSHSKTEHTLNAKLKGAGFCLVGCENMQVLHKVEPQKDLYLGQWHRREVRSQLGKQIKEL